LEFKSVTNKIASSLGHDASQKGKDHTGPPESHTRSIVKALSWRVIALLVTFFVVWIVTGKIEFAATAGGADALIKLLLYYLHERGWSYSRFGITRN
jgi:uncharacterized membrane protein